MQSHDYNHLGAPADCHVALELSRSKWLVGALLPGQEKVLTMTVSVGDADGPVRALADFADKAARRGYPDVRPRVCIEPNPQHAEILVASWRKQSFVCRPSS